MELNAAGAMLAAISVDPPEAGAALVEKLCLPFPVLSDPDGAGAIQPYGTWNAEQGIAFPAVVLVKPDGEEAFRRGSRDPADRAPDDELLAAARSLHLDPVEQQPPHPRNPLPGQKAFPLAGLEPFFRGVGSGAKNLGGRIEAAAEEAGLLAEEAERYAEAAHARAAQGG